MSREFWAAREAELLREMDRLQDDIIIARRLLELRDKHPHTSTVGQALALEGKTLDEWLEASA